MSGPLIQTRRSSRGMALVMVLLVVALMAVVATQLGSLVHRNIQQTSNREQYQQAYWYGIGGERLARALIEFALEQDERTHLGQGWANPQLLYPIEGGSIQLRVTDQRTCFNVNALTVATTSQGEEKEPAPKALTQLQALLQQQGWESYQAEALIEPLRDWVDSDTLPTGLNGAEDLHYSAKVPPYLPANGPMTDLTELNLIEAFTPPLPEEGAVAMGENDPAALRPWLCALPDAQFILNLNSLRAEQAPLLAALLEGKVPEDRLVTWLAERPVEGYQDVDEFWGLLAADEALNGAVDATVKDQLRVSSEFFLVRVEVNYYDANLVLYTRIFVREGKTVAYQRHYGVLNG